jgi:hypothetical protein
MVVSGVVSRLFTSWKADKDKAVRKKPADACAIRYRERNSPWPGNRAGAASPVRFSGILMPAS